MAPRNLPATRLIRWLAVMLLFVAAAWGGFAQAEHADPARKPALDPSLTRYQPGPPVSGALRIAGSTTMLPLINRLAAEFKRRHPDARIAVEGGGTASALAEFIAKPGLPKGSIHSAARAQELFVLAASRELTAEEVNSFAAHHGSPPAAVPVAVDAVGIYVHRDNPIPRLTLEQVDAIFSTTRYRGFPHAIDRWGQLGLEDEWGSAPIKLYGRDEKSGTRGFIKEHVLRNGEFDPRVQEEPGAASVILALSRDPLGIGYSGIGLQTSSVRPVPLAEHADGPYIAPSVASVMDGSYPLRRTLYLYLDKSPTRALRPIVQEFLSFLNSRDGQEVVVKTGFYPLPVAQIERNVAALGPLVR